MIVKVVVCALMNSVPFFFSRLEAGKPQENQKGTQSAAAFFGLSTLFEIVTPKTIDKFLSETATGFASLKLWN